TPTAGDYPLEARWAIRQSRAGFAGKLPPVIFELNSAETLVVAKRTDASVAALLKSLNKRLDESDKPDDNNLVRQCLEGVDLPALDPIARRLLSRDPESRERAMIWMFKCLPSERVTAYALEQVLDAKVRDPHEWLDI